MSNHSGTLYGGHYTACCRHPYKKDTWHLYNDRAVNGASKTNVISYEAYLLFLEKRQDGCDDEEELEVKKEEEAKSQGASQEGEEEEEEEEEW